MSGALLSIEHNILQKGFSYNINKANQLEFFVALEATFETTELAIESQENICQTVIPQIRRIKAADKIN